MFLLVYRLRSPFALGIETEVVKDLIMCKLRDILSNLELALVFLSINNVGPAAKLL